MSSAFRRRDGPRRPRRVLRGGRLVGRGHDRGDGARRKPHRRAAAKAHDLGGRIVVVSDACARGMEPFEQPHGLEELEPVALAKQMPIESAVGVSHSSDWNPDLGAHRFSTPRCSVVMTSSLKALIET